MGLSESEIDLFSARTHAYLVDMLGYHEGKALWNAGQYIHNLDQRALYYAAVVMDVEAIQNSLPTSSLKDFELYRWQPVGIKEFIESPAYLKRDPDEVWPHVMDELVKINDGTHVELLATGGIGSAKTTAAIYTNVYQLYLMSCMRDPHRVFGQGKEAEMLFIFQSINKNLAKTVDFQRFKNIISASPYFRDKFFYDKNIESRLNFPFNIGVVPVSGKDTAAIGQNVIGGLIDELNYMAIVEKSKQAVDKGAYDQAVAVYNSIARRRKTRFMKQGKLPGILCLVSSRKYPGQFTDTKEEEARTDPTIYVYDKRVWEVKPEGSFGPERFRVFIGDESRRPRVLKDGDATPEEALTIEVPTEFKKDFETDVLNALREIAGVATLARHPYMLDNEAVARSFIKKQKSIFSREDCDFVETKVKFFPTYFRNPELPRAVHIDLAVTGDSAGLAIGHCPRFVMLKDLAYAEDESLTESALQAMPLIVFDGLLEVKPPRNGEIMFYKIRRLLTLLRASGLNIKWITFDTYESRDSRQLLSQEGFVTEVLSIDKTCDPYDCLKAAIYTGRVQAPPHAKAQHELVTIEKDTKTGKIDHLPGFSKDVSDAMAGVCYTLTTRREIWVSAGVPVRRFLSSVQSQGQMEREPEVKMGAAGDDTIPEAQYVRRYRARAEKAKA